ncbi:hypothetical protein NLJ89_g5905 [Agrocybe chaxingu]|uniref:MYND-type domain-containing protein n=1 Tax=Agrocybe chaxingu TaxID=84603 RepID=A0A9W8JZP7_9AGAR|nr:hypothetical protein NLJ89_g5905 [Agrocybe chaxingu]
MAHNKWECTRIPRIALSELIHEESSESFGEKVRDAIFGDIQSNPRVDGSPHERWFRDVAQGPNAVRAKVTNSRLNGRLIAWKKDKPFDPTNLFFRTVDTSRLLPMALADFRIQWYASTGFWQWLEGRKNPEGHDPKKLWKTISVTMILFELLLIRNMHDYGGADIPIIIVDWSGEQLDRAMAYWVELSKDEWTKAEQERRYNEMGEMSCQRSNPCFYQVDLLVRSLLSDPEVGYVPRFIIFKANGMQFKDRALFTDPSFCPPQALISTFPTECGSRGCNDKDCNSFEFSACRSLMSDSSIVRDDALPQKTVRCNLWPCNVAEEEGEGGTRSFMKCQRCKEVLYCCKDHQMVDWSQHKLVCEVPS